MGKQIKDMPLKTYVGGNEDILIQDNGVTKRVKAESFVATSTSYDISAIENILGKQSEEVAMTFTNGYKYTPDGVKETDSNGRISNEILVEPGDKYRISIRTSEYYSFATFLDASNRLISCKNIGSGSGVVHLDGVEVTAPAGASKLVVCGTKSTNGTTTKLEKITIGSNLSDVYELDGTGEIRDGWIIDSRNGSGRSFNGMCTSDFVNVTGADKVLYTGLIYNFIGISGFDDSGRYVCSILDSVESGQYEMYVNHELVIPPGITKIKASSSKNGTYNPNDLFGITLVFDRIELISDIRDDLQDLKEATPVMNYIYVATNGDDTSGTGTSDNPYASIYKANESIINNTELNRYTIIVKKGTYTDLQTRYSGDTSTLGSYQGVICKDYVYYESEDINRPDQTIISWNGATGFSGEITQDKVFDKAPFHLTGGHTHVKGFKIVGSNLRYPFHIESSGIKGFDFEWEISNCLIDWTGRPAITNKETNSEPVFGMGTAHFERGVIRNCKILKSLGGDLIGGLQTHDNPWKKYENGNYTPYMYVGANILVENVDFGDNVVVVRTMVDPEYYDVPNHITLRNCTGISVLEHAFLNNKTTKEWVATVDCSAVADNKME